MSATKEDFPAEAEGLTITVDDVRKAGHCIAAGAKPWFANHGLDFRDFMRNGIDARRFWEKGDALSARVVRLALERRQAGAG